jgi:hypothetical protein
MRIVFGWQTAQPIRHRAIGESIERFNRLWDSLLPASHRSDLLPEACTTSAKPLPRSLSVVLVEKLEGVSVAGVRQMP